MLVLTSFVTQVVLVDGFLVCPESGRKFPVKDVRSYAVFALDSHARVYQGHVSHQKLACVRAVVYWL